jgi:hypothetical protein
MFWLDVDFKSGKNTVHRDDCVHSVPENNPSKGMSEMGEGGGWFSFPSMGEAVRYARVNMVNGLIVFCFHCKPTQAMTPEPRARLGVKTTSMGCAACGGCAMGQSPDQESVQITDTKTLASRLMKKLFGSR